VDFSDFDLSGEKKAILREKTTVFSATRFSENVSPPAGCFFEWNLCIFVKYLRDFRV
jgi:hypothetical protein